MNRFARIQAAAGICAGILLAALLIAAPAFAQEEATQPENTTAGWIFRWLNFAVVFFAILYVLVKKARPAFRAHREAIQAAIAEGTRARDEADQRRREAEQKLAGIQQEIEGMRAQSKKDNEAETARIRGLTREEAAKIDRAAELEIAAVRACGAMELKAHAARLAIERAETQLRRQVITAAHRFRNGPHFRGRSHGEPKLSAIAQRYAAALADVAMERENIRGNSRRIRRVCRCVSRIGGSAEFSCESGDRAATRNKD